MDDELVKNDDPITAESQQDEIRYVIAKLDREIVEAQASKFVDAREVAILQRRRQQQHEHLMALGEDNPEMDDDDLVEG
jgi:hypothetical protein